MVFGGRSGYAADDINKLPWMARVARAAFPHEAGVARGEVPFLDRGVAVRVGAGAPEPMRRSLVYRLSFFRFNDAGTEGARVARIPPLVCGGCWDGSTGPAASRPKAVAISLPTSSGSTSARTFYRFNTFRLVSQARAKCGGGRSTTQRTSLSRTLTRHTRAKTGWCGVGDDAWALSARILSGSGRRAPAGDSSVAHCTCSSLVPGKSRPCSAARAGRRELLPSCYFRSPTACPRRFEYTRCGGMLRRRVDNTKMGAAVPLALDRREQLLNSGAWLSGRRGCRPPPCVSCTMSCC